ncbi:MAG TPA: ComEC/Rec2 family competence protein [Polyangia bacterium]|nr:ComEC/Rec2 family competence protein [Polyangia bacterium]
MLRRCARWCLALGLLLVVAPPSVLAKGGPSERLTVDFIAVGQGDAALITSPAGKTVLIDGGPHESEADLVAFLHRRHTGPIDLVLLTHRHADHLGGLAAVVRSIGARMFMDATFPHPSPAYAELLETLQAAHVSVHNAERGRTVDLGGGAILTLLGPPEPAITGSRSDVNANSVVARLDFGRVGFLFAGDAEAKTEDWLLRAGLPLRAQVLKVAHHGSRYSSTARFLRAVRPSLAVISVGARNDYGHPAERTIEALGRLPAQVLRTDRDGTITVESDGAHLDVRTTSGNREILAAP